jgi:hypothetical protein
MSSLTLDRLRLVVEPDLVHLDGGAACVTLRAHRIERLVSATEVIFGIEERHAETAAAVAVDENHDPFGAFEPGGRVAGFRLDPIDRPLHGAFVAAFKSCDANEHGRLLPSLSGRSTLNQTFALAPFELVDQDAAQFGELCWRVVERVEDDWDVEAREWPPA